MSSPSLGKCKLTVRECSGYSGHEGPAPPQGGREQLETPEPDPAVERNTHPVLQKRAEAVQAAPLSRTRNVRRAAELDSGSCRPFGEALGDQSCSFSRGAGVGHRACLSGLGPAAGWEVEPVLPRGLLHWG